MALEQLGPAVGLFDGMWPFKLPCINGLDEINKSSSLILYYSFCTIN